VTRIVLIASGGAGFLILTRAMVLSPTVGPEGATLSRALFAIMAIALAAGLGELWQRQRRADIGWSGIEALSAKLAGGDRRAADADIEALDGPVSARIRARVERMPTAASPPSFATTLAGLLVVVGLLGGFIGVIQTLAGAEEALNATGGVRALRSALAEPVIGLADGVEMTFAGIAAAALLIFASIGVRRSEQQLGALADDFAAGPRAPLSTLGDQLQLMQSMVQQGEALPVAAGALRDVSEKIVALEEVWTRSHEQSSQATLGIVREAVSDFRSDMKHAVEESVRGTKEAVVPLLEDAMERTVRAATGHLDGVLEGLEQDFAARRESEAVHTLKLEQHTGELLTQIGAERERREQGALELAERDAAQAHRLEGVVEQLGALADTQATAGERMEAALQSSSGGMIDRLGDVSADLQASGDRQLSSVAEYIEQAEGRAVRLEADANGRVDALLEGFSTTLEEQSKRLLELEARLAEQSRAHAEQLADGLGARGEALAEGLGATGELVREAADLVKAGGAEMSGVAEMFGQAVDRQRDAATAWLESLGEVEGAVERAGQGAAADALRDQLAHTQELFGRQLQFQRELFGQLRELRSDQAPAAEVEPGVERAPGEAEDGGVEAAGA